MSYDIAQQKIDLEEDLDVFWTCLTGAVVLIMQVGFAFLEAGCVRFKNMQSIMLKVVLNTAISIIMMWAVGYGIMFGTSTNSFIGNNEFFGKGYNKRTYGDFVFNSSLAAAANSIVSGGAAERMSFFGYILLSVFFSGWIYPVVISWCYNSNGWLKNLGYHDFAGSGAIHLTAGVGALVLTIMLKPRKDRFEKENLFKNASPIYICLSCLTLYMAWMCFNSGSSLALSKGAIYIVGRSVINTMIGGAVGGLTVFGLHYLINSNTNNRYSLIMMCNGNLAGLVAVTGSNDDIENWAACAIGVLGGFMYYICAKILHAIKVDDPVDAVPIHAGCGLLGSFCVGWFSRTTGIYYGFGAYQWGVQVLGCICFIGWSAAWHIVFILILSALKLLRVSDEVEEKGLDYEYCGGPAFYFEPIRDQEMISGRDSASNKPTRVIQTE
ncbi:hypothetical protein pb186bvf_019398 [Paramecium bursaria]